MHKLEDLKERLCMELEEYADRRELSMSSLEIIHKLTDTIKNIDKIRKLENEAYSGRDYERGESERRRRTSYDRGYSRDEGKEHMLRKLRDMLDESGEEKQREVIRRCMEALERA